MKRFFTILLFLATFFGPLRSPAQQDRNKVEALRISFISKRLELTPAESEKFWPVYNEYNDKLRAIKRNLRTSYHKKSGELSDNEAEELYQLDVQSKQAEADVHKHYSERIKGIIGVKKTVKLRLAEEEFKREMINTIREKGD
ncbi:MAG: hypothetical protein PSX36_15845 [bacterium]|nr:hypothetical protein [bacterium]